MNTVVGLMLVPAFAEASTPTPTPTAPGYDPVTITPGPIGFFVTIAIFLAVGVLAMSLMRRSSRAIARFEIREQLEAERAAAAADESAHPEGVKLPPRHEKLEGGNDDSGA